MWKVVNFYTSQVEECLMGELNQYVEELLKDASRSVQVAVGRKYSECVVEYPTLTKQDVNHIKALCKQWIKKEEEW